jgi:hypothetical protein
MSVALNARRLILAVGGKALVIPPGGWTAQNFVQHGGPMIRTMSYIAKLTQRRAVPGMAKAIYAIMRKQLDEVIARVTRTRARSASMKADEISIDIGQNEHLWAQVMDDVFKAAGLEIEVTVLPTITSVMGQGYSKVGMLLSQEADPAINPAIARQARAIAQQVTAINDTTRKQMEKVIRSSIDQNLTVSETATAMQNELPGLFGNRALTIARTELNRAWTQGAVQSFQSSSTLTHISVIGCESREEDRWQQPSFAQYLYRGEGTCNIEDVPVGDAGDLVFHPNHTGNMVPSKFRNEDGTADLEND